jgi:hypothetical protein
MPIDVPGRKIYAEPTYAPMVTQRHSQRLQ